jgi:hypothetical protein
LYKAAMQVISSKIKERFNCPLLLFEFHVKGQ